jgi:quercetin dioxygenase-like cupin family protein
MRFLTLMMVVGITGASLVSAAVVAAAEGQPAGNAVFLPAASMKFADVPGLPGVQMAVVEGDPAKGPGHAFFKFKGGFAAPLHYHTSDHYVSVLSGTVVLTVDGKEQRLPAGSYFAFTGKKQHMTKCETGTDCLLFLDVRGPWDVVPVEAKAETKK